MELQKTSVIGARLALCLAAALAAACSSSAAEKPKTDAAVAADVAVDAVALPDAATLATAPTWHDSFAVCWTDMTCQRAFVISHGGDWASGDGRPYDSKAAFLRAYDKGADGIKTDFLVSVDNVGIVAHSSPIEFWESSECQGKLIEQMTAAEVTACHLFDLPEDAQTQTYQRVDDVIEWARGKVTLMLTVKDSTAFARAIETILEHKAADFVHIETHFGDLALIQTLPNWDKVRYTVQIDDQLADIDTLVKLPPVLFCEMNPTYTGLDAAGLKTLIDTKVHAAGMRAFVSSQTLPSVEQHKGLWDAGFDVVMTYNLANAMEARTAVNAARGISPP